jgi:UDP-glucose 4-epimerase
MILLTGATGYIGSHTWVELLDAGYEVVGCDNFSNSSPSVLKRIEKITQSQPAFIECDVQDQVVLADIFKRHKIKAVVHFAALKAVGESVQKPLNYYANNLNGLLSLLKVMQSFDCHHFVFSSSATVYHPGNPIPYVEGMPLGSTSPYGWTKCMSEQILRDLELSDPSWRVAYLRYFNPVGAHPSGLIGEDPRGVPNNLMPFVTQVAVGKRPELSIFGGDWPTHDGTGVRDYIHVIDLARGHVKAVEYLLGQQKSITVNLGAGKGYSVLDLVKSFEQASGRPIPYRIVDRRPGDIAAFYADAALAEKLLNWRVECDLDQMCRDSWNWQSNNPNGFEA